MGSMMECFTGNEAEVANESKREYLFSAGEALCDVTKNTGPTLIKI